MKWKARDAAAVALALASGAPGAAMAQRFTVTDSSVRQGPFQAVALSRDSIASSYPRAAREVRFRFSINGLENEFPGGTEHTIYLRPRRGRLVTGIYRFGHEDPPPPPTPEQGATSEDGVARVTFRLDMREVLAALRTTGRYLPPLGAPILRGGLEHVYVLGDPAPLSWDYAALRAGSPAELTDADGDGIYEGVVPIATEYTRPRMADGRAVWARRADLARFPALHSSQRIQDAIYRLSLEELTQLVRGDGALSAGAKWPGVWTRDVAMSTILSLAIVAPDAARTSLLAKVDSGGRIIQDTGTGGSWPVSSDRMVWTLAAWEVYAATGDRDWLRRAYDITRRSAEADLHALPGDDGLLRGESTFMDWREQSYPRWMQPADIYQSRSLGTNVIHYAAYRVLGNMARALGEPAARWDSVAAGVHVGLARLWMPGRGYFGEYLYGAPFAALSPRSEGLGEALAVIYGAADASRRDSLVAEAPVMPFGVPSFWPFTPGERLYHNATIWPFVTAFWSWAAADGGNTLAVRRGLDDATRTTALFLTNKENTVAATGHYEGTALNSDRQLWSVAGTLAGTYRVLFGIRLEAERLAFRPMVPPSYTGERMLTGLRYRGATLDVVERGFGSAVSSATLDGVPLASAELPASLTGAHRVELVMNGRWPASIVHEVAAVFAPATPRATLRGERLSWSPVPGAVRYEVFRNGARLSTMAGTSVAVGMGNGLDEWQVLAVSAAGDESFLSEPVRVVADGAEWVVKPAGTVMATYAGYTGAGYLRLAPEENAQVQLSFGAPVSGDYLVDLRYANGNGPVNTEDKVAVRTVLVDGDTAGVVVMPQRGAGRWSEWGWSSALRVHMLPGTHRVTVAYTRLDRNMNGHENTALLDLVRFTRLGDAPPHPVTAP